MLEVQYESVVEDIETQARRILDYCGLPWDPRCIAFHETHRPVRTASVDQVRRPIYRSSLQRWKPYKSQLGPLIEALASDPTAEPEGAPAAMPAPTPRIGAMSLAGEDLLPRALRAHREGKLVMADKLYRRILEITPGDVSASQLLGVVRAQQRRFTEAEPLLLRAATADPANADAQNNLGNVLLELGRPLEAAERFRRAIAAQAASFPTPITISAMRSAGWTSPTPRSPPIGRRSSCSPAIATRCSISPTCCAGPSSPRRHRASGAPSVAPSARWRGPWPCSPPCCTRPGVWPRPSTHFDRALALNPRLAGVHYNRVRMTTVRPDDPQLSGDAGAGGPRPGAERDRPQPAAHGPGKGL